MAGDHSAHVQAPVEDHCINTLVLANASSAGDGGAWVVDVFAVKKDLMEDSGGGQDLQDCGVAEAFQDVWAGCRHADAAGFGETRECGIHGCVAEAKEYARSMLNGYAVALLVSAVVVE